MRELLTTRKLDNEQLLLRFDGNHDGEIDLNEWEVTRQAARSEAEQRIRRYTLSQQPIMFFGQKTAIHYPCYSRKRDYWQLSPQCCCDVTLPFSCGWLFLSGKYTHTGSNRQSTH